MAVKDIRSNVITQFMGSLPVAADSTAPFTGVIDNAAYEIGVMFSVRVGTAGTATSVDLTVQESDDPTFATFDTIDNISDKLIGTGSVDVTAATLEPTATASLTTENRMVTVGVFSNRRYLRPAVVDVGGATYVLECYANQAAENLPVVEPDA